MVNEEASPITAALQAFDATEANLAKLERLCGEIRELIPTGIVFGTNVVYDDKCRAFLDVLGALPTIDGWKPDIEFLDLDEIAEWRFDAQEIGEPGPYINLGQRLDAPEGAIAEYRFHFNKKRRQLVRHALSDVIGAIDVILLELRSQYLPASKVEGRIEDPRLDELAVKLTQVDTLLGSTFPRPKKWDDLTRHVHFGFSSDLADIVLRDWPPVKAYILQNLFEEDEPLPVHVDDLGTVAAERPSGTVATRLNWERLTPEDFERLIFNLVDGASGYENPEWLMRTNAPDRGRDISVFRVASDSLSGVERRRVIIQCRHQPERSISDSDVATLRTQMNHWGAPRVDVLVIATTGRFSADAVSSIEMQNQSADALHIDMWPESHIERLLAQRPDLVAQFGLR